MLKKKLGRGLDALIGPGTLSDTVAPDGLPGQEPAAAASPAPTGAAPAAPPSAIVNGINMADPLGVVCDIEIDRVEPNRFQPRKTFDQASLRELMASISSNGIIQPLVVRPSAHDRFELVAGERRYRAALALGLTTVPVVVRLVQDDRMLEMALIENIQREDLNPIEKAEAFREFMFRYGHTQETAAGRLGVDRASLANHIRLLELPVEIQTLVMRGALRMGHARAIAAVTDAGLQLALAKRAIQKGMNVRQLEKMIGRLMGADARLKAASRAKSAQAAAIEEELRRILGSKVRIQESLRKGVGRIVIDYYSLADFDRILAVLRRP